MSARYFARVQQECKDQFPDSVMFFSIAIDEPGSISYSELLQEPDTAPLKLDRLPATCYFLNKHPIVVARPGWQDDVKLVGSITKQAFMDSVTTARLLLTQKRHVEHICIDE